MKVQELFEKASEMENLKKNKVPLTDEERNKVMKAKAVWHHGPNGKETSAVWKSINPKTKKVTYVTNTHRQYSTSSTLKGIINKFHIFIKGTS